MTNISFYILKGNSEHDRQVFACRLAAKAYYQGKQVYIHTDGNEAAVLMDKTLWSFKPDSFIPHDRFDNPQQVDSPILIGYQSEPPKLMDLLINLAPEQPNFFSQFDRVAEFINDDEHIKISGRQRYQFYQHRGYELTTHNIAP